MVLVVTVASSHSAGKCTSKMKKILTSPSANLILKITLSPHHQWVGSVGIGIGVVLALHWHSLALHLTSEAVIM